MPLDLRRFNDLRHGLERFVRKTTAFGTIGLRRR
jgi:hypothetical protein